jgi:hypothetical protein
MIYLPPQLGVASASSSVAPNPKIVELLNKGDRMGATKVHRALYNSSFEEAKKALEMIKPEPGLWLFPVHTSLLCQTGHPIGDDRFD